MEGSGCIFIAPYALNLAIMDTREQKQGGDSADERIKHVGLSIPRVALRSQERIGTLSQSNGHTPLNEFVRCTDGQNDADHDKGEHLSSAHVLTSNENLASGKGGHKTLKKVPDFVVWVAAKAKKIGEMEAERNSCVRVCTPDHEHNGVQEDANIKQGG